MARMRTSPVLLIAALGWAWLLPASAWGENWIANGDFEADAPPRWRGAALERQVVHAGKGALRLEKRADQPGASARYEPPIQCKQTQPETMMAAFWMRLDAKHQAAAVRGGLTFRVEMSDGASMAWYGPFEMDPCEMGSWVYREARWKPPAPVKTIRASAYLQGCAGSLFVDDLYLGPPVELPTPPCKTIPLAVSGKGGRFADWAQFEYTAFRPTAHVFHLAEKNKANLELAARIDVLRPAPIYLTSAWGSQYWTLYNATQRQIVQIHTDERLDLATAGPREAAVRMNAFSAGASDMVPGGYVFLTDCSKSFLIYPAGQSGGKQLDTVKVERLSRVLGAQGVTAPFSLADLSSYRLSVSARRDATGIVVRPILTDAGNTAVPLYDLELHGATGSKSLPLEPQVADDGVPTGDYRGNFSPAQAGSIRVTGTVRLATPAGIHEERIDRSIPIAGVASIAAAKPVIPRLALAGWGYPAYELSLKRSEGPASVERLVADARAAGVSKLMVHARTAKETLYPSRIAAPGAAVEWDVMAAAVAAGKKQGVAIYAAYVLGIAQEADLKAHPDWAALDPDGKPTGWYCHTHPEVRAFHAALLAEIVTRYDVAGVSLDYVRPGGGCFCPRCAKAFEADCHKRLDKTVQSDPAWKAWQRDRITDYVRQLRAALRKARPAAELAGYVWARFAADKDRAGQDWPRWLNEGLMDFVAVGQYTPSTPWFRAECHALREIAERQLQGDVRRICPLLGVGYIQQANPSHAAASAVIDRHLWAARQEGLAGAGFFAFYGVRPHLATVRAHSDWPPPAKPND